jgi:Eco57I restriction-modification methylase
MPRSTRTTLTLAADAITVEGALIPPAMLARMAAQQADGQSEEDYRVPKGLTLRDEIARYFRIGQALFTDLHARSLPSAAKTVAFVEALFREVFGFADLVRVSTPILDGQLFPPTLEGLRGRAPIVVVPPNDELDHPSEHLTSDHRRRSAASALQDWLNANEKALWGICCNGDRLRLVRDNASLTRPSYIEADLRNIFENENFADFTTLWLLIHSSRFGVSGAVSSDSYLEHWREAGQREGVIARDRLRDGVEAALLALGTGFLAHGKNGALRDRLRTGTLPLSEFFGQLLRLVYRLIFLLTAEDRELLHMPGASVQVRKLYADGYSIGLLRDRAVRRAAWDRHHDRWEGLLITFSALASGESRLGLPALGGLFASGSISDLEAAHLSNRALMQGIYRLAWLRENSGLFQVNWRDMETEELGSVYESLLELTPQLTDNGHALGFAEGRETKGHARKTTGSYYTPDALVQALLDSALDPVLDRTEAEADDPAQALLSVTVIDPACGSGHFLLGSARRIATRLAKARAGGVASASDFRHALRDVVRSCIYGVDRNPMAVELTKVALWIETVEPGKPLGFLDTNIRCGDSLFGVYDLEALRIGIPDGAYKPLSGDDKETAKFFERKNKAEREGQGVLDFAHGGGKLPPIAPLAGQARALRALPEDSPEEIATKRARFQADRSSLRQQAMRIAADLYVAAFLIPKAGNACTSGNAVTIPTSAHVWAAALGSMPNGPLVSSAQKVATERRSFHWPLEFPEVFAAGGFDAVIGNPPWERVEMQEREFFAARAPEVAAAKNSARRKDLIQALDENEPLLAEQYRLAQRNPQAEVLFLKESGRFPLGSVGKVNTYAVFADLFRQSIHSHGVAALLLPSGMVTGFTYRSFLQHLLKTHTLASFFGFENEDLIFPEVTNKTKFGILTIMGSQRPVEHPWFTANVRQPDQIHDPLRRYSLTSDEIESINPNTLNLPAFRWKADAEVAAAIHAVAPVLVRRHTDGHVESPWGVDFRQLFNMATDSGLFIDHSEIVLHIRERHGSLAILDDGRQVYPLYEGKMLWHFDHRYGTYEGQTEKQANKGVVPHVDDLAHNDANYRIQPQYWVEATKLQDILANEGDKQWFFAWRDVGPSERTFVGALVPKAAAGHKAPLLISQLDTRSVAALIGILSSLVVDYDARQRSSQMSFFVVEQLAVLSPEALGVNHAYLGEPARDWLAERVLELSYTNIELTPFAHELGFTHPPFTWQPERRALIQAEIDAAILHLYRLSRQQTEWILDSFTVLRKYEDHEHGEFRTRRLVLEVYDAIAKAQDLGTAYQTVLDPPPGDFRCCHVAVTEISAADAKSVKLPKEIDFSLLADGAWSNTNAGPDATLAQLAALINALPGPTAISRVRLAALYALEPRYLTPHLSGAERATWRRLIGPAADPFTGTNVAAFAPSIDAAWGKAVSQLRGMKAISENIQLQTWAAGPKLNQSDFDPAEWTHGRATFVFRALEQITPYDATSTLAAEDQVWVNAA